MSQLLLIHTENKIYKIEKFHQHNPMDYFIEQSFILHFTKDNNIINAMTDSYIL